MCIILSKSNISSKIYNFGEYASLLSAKQPKGNKYSRLKNQPERKGHGFGTKRTRVPILPPLFGRRKQQQVRGGLFIDSFTSLHL